MKGVHPIPEKIQVQNSTKYQNTVRPLQLNVNKLGDSSTSAHSKSTQNMPRWVFLLQVRETIANVSGPSENKRIINRRNENANEDYRLP